jgi:hypothetical protein
MELLLIVLHFRGENVELSFEECNVVNEAAVCRLLPLRGRASRCVPLLSTSSQEKGSSARTFSYIHILSKTLGIACFPWDLCFYSIINSNIICSQHDLISCIQTLKTSNALE